MTYIFLHLLLGNSSQIMLFNSLLKIIFLSDSINSSFSESLDWYHGCWKINLGYSFVDAVWMCLKPNFWCCAVALSLDMLRTSIRRMIAACFFDHSMVLHQNFWNYKQAPLNWSKPIQAWSNEWYRGMLQHFVF